MIYIKHKMEDGRPTGLLYYGDYSEACSFAFAQGWNDAQMIVFRLEGHDYRSYQSDLRHIATDFQMLDEGGLSYGELADIQGFFERYGRKYGLLREFRENGIC